MPKATFDLKPGMTFAPTQDRPAMQRLERNPMCLVLCFVLTGVYALCAPSLAMADQPDFGLNKIEREIWSDPDFQRRFAESYLSETEIEPRLSPAEQALLSKVFEIIQTNAEEESEDAEAQGAVDAEAAKEAEQARRDRERRREEMGIEMDIDGDGMDEDPFTVALFELEQYKESVDQEQSISAMIYFFTANFHLQQATKLEVSEDASEAEREAIETQRTEKLQLAARDYRIATVRHEKFRRAWRNLGLLYVRLRQFDDARDAFSRVIELGGGDSDTYGLLGYCFSQLKQFLPAESAYRMANLLDPSEGNWQMGLVSSFFFQQRYTDVVALTSDMIKKDPENAELWKLQANAYIGLEQPMKAAENYEFIDGLGASDVQTLSMLANIYTNAGLQDPAVSAYVKALGLAKGPEAKRLADQLQRGAGVLASQGAIDAAKRLIQAVDEKLGDQFTEDEQKQWLKLRARIAVTEEATGEEVKLLEEIVALDPLDGEAIILLGQNAVKQGKNELAINYFERAAALEGFEYDAYLEHARLLTKMKRYSDALTLLNRAKQIKSSEPLLRFIENVERVNRAS